MYCSGSVGVGFLFYNSDGKQFALGVSIFSCLNINNIYDDSISAGSALAFIGTIVSKLHSIHVVTCRAVFTNLFIQYCTNF